MLAASQLKQAGDPVNQSPTRSQNLPDKNRGLPATHLFPKRPTRLDHGMPQVGASNTRAEQASQPVKLRLPPTPASHPMAKYDYRKGDEATTLEEFKKAVAGDYQVTSNKAAKNPEIFNKNPIMVYGEFHPDPKTPSLRTPKGVLLIESAAMRRCLPKHLLDSSNRCISIDTNELHRSSAIRSLADCALKATAVVDLINPRAMMQINEKVSASSGQATHVIDEAAIFVSRSYDSAYSKCSSPQEKSRLSDAREAFFESIEASNQIISKGSREREKTMFLKCETAIKQLQPDASATVVVGDMHSRFLFTQLGKKFPDRAVVLARDVNSPLIDSAF